MRGCWLALALCLLAAGCAGGEPSPDTPTETPRLGGALTRATPPAGEMDDLERQVTEPLAKEVAGQGLRVDRLDCPPWDHHMPAELTCDGWFDGVHGTVLVKLSRNKHGAVAFDAELREGVIATKRLVDELAAKGYRDVDCGESPAYPAETGQTITCAATESGVKKYLVATVTDPRGGMQIRDF